MRLVIAGGTGFIGSNLTRRLVRGGHSITLLSRRSSPASDTAAIKTEVWDAASPGPWHAAINGADAVVNLVGERIDARRWTTAQKARIRSSRLDATRALVRAMGEAANRPKILVNASAIGYYGPRGDEPLTESSPPGGGFLATLAVEWEAEAKKAADHGARVVLIRTGLVLARRGGALSKMALPFKFFIGGPLGSGRQWVSWIHLEDEVGLIQFLLDHPTASGPVNATAPNPMTMKEFCSILGMVMRRPSWAPVPSFALRLLLGEMAEMLITGQRVQPARARELGYDFRYADLAAALRDCLTR
jgi:hypothetical protein